MRRPSTAPRLLLVSMPFGALERPALGIGLLKAGVRRAGFACDVRYLTMPFAHALGVEDYRWFVADAPYTAFAGDWAFAGALHQRDPERDAEYVNDVLRATWQLDDEAVGRVLRARSLAAPFLDECLRSVPFADYDVVGFTSTFEQNLASLAMAQRIKRAHPDVLTAFGGANWEGPMGRALHETYPFVDIAFNGEADVSLPAALGALADGRPLTDVEGLVVRVGTDSVSTGAPVRLADLDDLPVPDLTDFFTAKAAWPTLRDVPSLLLMETARGCWWGAHSHCTFCGLNGESMAFRSKSPSRALAELSTLTELHGIRQVHMVDNIIDMRYFRTLLPELARRSDRLELFYEVKANLSHAHVRALATAGVNEIQPGIESMSDHVLALMRKGTTALRNVALLKWCCEFGVRVDWNLLYGFPGETAADYAAILDLLVSIEHLQAPSACGPIRLDRFSPYSEDPDSFGMTDLRPLAPYRYLYPDAGDRLFDIACYFDFDRVDGRAADDVARPVIEYWHRRRSRPTGRLVQLAPTGVADERVVVVDERRGPRTTTVLDGWQATVYHRCDRAQDTAAVVDLAQRTAPTVTRDDVVDFVHQMERARLMLGRGDQHLSLAVHHPPRWEPTATSPRLHRTLAVSSA